MAGSPFWSLTIFSLDILAIYGLIAYGKRISSAACARGIDDSVASE